MRFRFTQHVKQKIVQMQHYGFMVNKTVIKNTINSPVRIEKRSDNTEIATTLLDTKHCLRVVYRTDNDIIVIITCYPGRRKYYGI